MIPPDHQLGRLRDRVFSDVQAPLSPITPFFPLCELRFRSLMRVTPESNLLAIMPPKVNLSSGKKTREIQYVCLSDMHLGEEDSLLTNLKTASTEVDPFQPSPVMIQLVECIKALLKGQSAKPTLVLNGDILEMALTTDNQAAMVFERFVELIMPDGGELFDRVIYIPGNHDHHLWESARETQYVNFIAQIAPGSPLDIPWHTTNLFVDKDKDLKFLESLLNNMDLAFCLSGEYRRNIAGFKGRYLFRTADGAVAASAVFDRGNMRVRKEGIGDWNVRVTFRDAEGLRAFLFSKNQDILDSILRNDVEVDGNLNYVYKLGFMARELTRRLGLAG